MSANGSYQFSIGLGALFFYMISGFKHNYNYFDSDKFKKRNLWTGYTIQLIFGFLIIYLVLKFS